MLKRKKIRCLIGWHKPLVYVSFDNINFKSICSCGANIMQDSQGNWFKYVPKNNSDQQDPKP